jgi:hypothetical protein
MRQYALFIPFKGKGSLFFSSQGQLTESHFVFLPLLYPNYNLLHKRLYICKFLAHRLLNAYWNSEIIKPVNAAD